MPASIRGYEIIRPLGAGAMGQVYEARHALLGRHVALKVMQDTPGAQGSLRARFADGARLQARLRHPRIVEVTELFEDAGRFVMVMELVEGPSLADVLEGVDRPILRPLAAVDLCIGVVEAVAAAHAAGVIHRDIKPGNVLLAGHDPGCLAATPISDAARLGDPRVTDFDIARLVNADHRRTRLGATLGTPPYMAPEQWRDASTVDERADVFALGMMLWELLTGRLPVNPDSQKALYELYTGQRPIPMPPHVGTALASVLGQCLAIDPAQRLADAGVLHRALNEVRTLVEVAEGAHPNEGDGAHGMPEAAREHSPGFARPNTPPQVGAGTTTAADAGARPTPGEPSTVVGHRAVRRSTDLTGGRGHGAGIGRRRGLFAVAVVLAAATGVLLAFGLVRNPAEGSAAPADDDAGPVAPGDTRSGPSDPRAPTPPLPPMLDAEQTAKAVEWFENPNKLACADFQGALRQRLSLPAAATTAELANAIAHRQATRELEVDGVPGPETQDALFGDDLRWSACPPPFQIPDDTQSLAELIQSRGCAFSHPRNRLGCITAFVRDGNARIRFAFRTLKPNGTRNYYRLMLYDGPLVYDPSSRQLDNFHKAFSHLTAGRTGYARDGQPIDFDRVQVLSSTPLGAGGSASPPLQHTFEVQVEGSRYTAITPDLRRLRKGADYADRHDLCMEWGVIGAVRYPSVDFIAIEVTAVERWTDVDGFSPCYVTEAVAPIERGRQWLVAEAVAAGGHR